MKTHVIKSGESMWSIAKAYGFLDWRELYNHSANAVFRKLRPDPGHVLPGDKLFIPETKAPPASTAPAVTSPSVFEEYLQHFSLLEKAAIEEGHASLRRRITDFRLIYYPNGAPAKQYFGIVVGGGTWSILIPGAATDREPRGWARGELAASREFLRKHQVVPINGVPVDLGHLFAGLDARNHPASISLGGIVHLKSNMAAATYAGDLGSVAGEYILGSKKSVHDLASKVDAVWLKQKYDAFISPEDTAGNVDAYSMPIESSRSVTQNLKAYYAPTGGVARRYTRFSSQAGLKDRSVQVDLVFNSTLAYLASKGHRAQVLAVISDPGPQLFGYSLWDVYYNVSQWVVDAFTERIRKAMARE